jgi:hypothetical protein
MVKNNYKYWLANGECVEYSLSPDSKIEDVISELAADYVSSQITWVPDQVLLEPAIFRRLELQMNQRYNMIHLQNYSPPVGFSQLILQSLIGPLKIVAVPDLEFPIFIGRHEEYKDNCFNALMEEILCE